MRKFKVKGLKCKVSKMSVPWLPRAKAWFFSYQQTILGLKE